MNLFQCAPINNPTFVGTVTVSGSLVLTGASIERAYALSSPANGASVTISPTTRVEIITPVGGIAVSNTIIFPAPQDGLRFECVFTGACSHVSITATGTVQNAPTAMLAGTSFEYLYVGTTTTWVRIR
jgi:hypothetical protein